MLKEKQIIKLGVMIKIEGEIRFCYLKLKRSKGRKFEGHESVNNDC